MKKGSLLVAAAFAVQMNAQAADYRLSADLVVVGAGSAGLSAAVQGAEKGKKVILLEKRAGVGGSSQFAEGLFAVDSMWNRDRGDPLTREKAHRDFIERQNYQVDVHKNKDFVEGSAENIEWLASKGIAFEVKRESPWKDNTWHIIKEFKGTDHGAGLIKGLKEAADKLGVETKLSTPATDLIVKDGSVEGVIAKDSKGDIYTITSKAVILASGGFGDDPEKIKNWLRKDPASLKSSVPLGKTGDGISMAMRAGAALGNVSYIGHLGTEGGGIKFLGNLYAASWQPAALWVNANGERFTNEETAFAFSQAANAIYGQPGHYGWAIFDQGDVDYLADKGIDSGIGVLVPMGTKLTKLKEEIAEALKADSEALKSADSVAALAKAIGVPEDALEKSVALYNGYCQQEHDPLMYKERRYLRPLDTKKLYALKIKAYYFSTYGGLNTNRRHEVLDKNNKPIPGLYAAGLEVSDMIGPTYPDFVSGHAFGFASYSGRHAALNAIEKMK